MEREERADRVRQREWGEGRVIGGGRKGGGREVI